MSDLTVQEIAAIKAVPFGQGTACRSYGEIPVIVDGKQQKAKITTWAIYHQDRSTVFYYAQIKYPDGQKTTRPVGTRQEACNLAIGLLIPMYDPSRNLNLE